MKYRIGLDVGIGSVGWSVIENDDNDNPIRISDLGVRCFDVAEVPKTGASLASARREARSARRRLRRRRHRLDSIKELFEEYDIVSKDRLEKLFDESCKYNVYEIRNRALTSVITNDELAVVLYHIAKHRGFKSTRKCETSDKEAGKLLSATAENKKILDEKGYKTIGQMLYCDDKFRTILSDGQVVCNIRNKGESYKNSILRDMLIDEVKIIFDCQNELGNSINSEFIKNYLEVMQWQRPYDIGPGKMPNGENSPYGGNLIEKMQGKCTFEKDEKRAFKATYTFQIFTLLQAINNIKIFCSENRVKRTVTNDEREEIINKAHITAEINYTHIRKLLKLNDNNYFANLNYGNKDREVVEKKSKFNYLKSYHDIRKKCDKVDKKYFKTLSEDTLDEIGTILSLYKNDANRIEKLSFIGIPEEIISELLYLNFTKTGNLSLKAMKKINPYLKQGKLYYEACESAEYDFKADNKDNKSHLLNPSDILCDVPNPVVRRAVSQTIKVINSIIKKYGSPQLVCVELAREMAKNHDERVKLTKIYKENADKNQKIKEEIKELGFNPTGFDIVKYKLWKEQNETCAYSLKHISLNQLFDKNMVDIDHIIPYSKSFDDSYNNKVLVFADENRQKGNRTPIEYLSNNDEKLHNFIVFANKVKNYKKREKLLKESFSEDEEDFKERNLQDTKYISSLLYNYIKNNLEFAPSRQFRKKPVRCNNGTVTAYLRKRWGINKSRIESDIHHCKDACVVACVTQKMINDISFYVKGRELRYSFKNKIVDKETGQVIETKEQYDELYGVNFPEPWKGFRKELEVRTSNNPMSFEPMFNELGYPLGKEIKPVFISRMPKHSVTGSGHDATIRGIKKGEEGIVVTKTPLTKLKWDKDKKEIKGYYNKEDDKLLYDALCKKLAENNFDAKKAFGLEEPFRKPKSDGTDGPIVKKVKTEEKQTLGVKLHDNKGVAANGDMIRIDVFKENEKYYFVPIYTADIKKEKLPCKAATSNKPYSEWKEMSEDNFIFSLFSRDLIKISNSKPIMCKTSTGEEVDINNSLVYYIGADISALTWRVISHDNSICESDTVKGKRISITKFKSIIKYQVDVLGNVSEVKKEKRQKFSDMKK